MVNQSRPDLIFGCHPDSVQLLICDYLEEYRPEWQDAKQTRSIWQVNARRRNHGLVRHLAANALPTGRREGMVNKIGVRPEASAEALLVIAWRCNRDRKLAFGCQTDTIQLMPDQLEE